MIPLNLQHQCSNTNLPPPTRTLNRHGVRSLTNIQSSPNQNPNPNPNAHGAAMEKGGKDESVRVSFKAVVFSLPSKVFANRQTKSSTLLVSQCCVRARLRQGTPSQGLHGESVASLSQLHPRDTTERRRVVAGQNAKKASFRNRPQLLALLNVDTTRNTCQKVSEAAQSRRRVVMMDDNVEIVNLDRGS